jgi:hypothetical protein
MQSRRAKANLAGDRQKVGQLGLTFIILSMILSSGSFVGCMPYYGRAQQRVVHDPRVFVGPDASSAVLIIPRYRSSVGVSTGAGHGPGSMRDTVYVAHPFLYHQHEKFNLRQPKSLGIIWGLWAFTGKGITIDGVLVVASGYEPQWVWNLWSKDSPVLVPLSNRAAQDELQTLSAILDHKALRGPKEKGLFSYAGDDPVYVRLTRGERQMVRSFLSDGLAKLDSGHH